MIPISRPYVDFSELREINMVLKSRWISQGHEVKKFEQRIAEYLKVKSEFTRYIQSCISTTNLSGNDDR